MDVRRPLLGIFAAIFYAIPWPSLCLASDEGGYLRRIAAERMELTKRIPRYLETLLDAERQSVEKTIQGLSVHAILTLASHDLADAHRALDENNPEGAALLIARGAGYESIAARLLFNLQEQVEFSEIP